ncbi:MAG TPA: SMC family ATPase, partial [Acidimicrobiales bacterium]|nr:SMC family ATPase [Acidimicrobiales bacterium]
MLIDRIYLRNYRVFEAELELLLPPGLVGVYGPNGAGKSTLLESVLWTLWGRARTAKEEIPSAGARGECIAEVTFEQEGHIYFVRRTVSGANANVKAEAHCDGLAMAQGARDTSRYVHSVLGMDDAAFRASVFAEQKQLAAFSLQSPAERRKLVLSLLGVTPLDGARDQARADAREAAQQHDRLRAMLPDVEEAAVKASDAEARAAAAEVAAGDEESAAAAAQELLRRSTDDLSRLDLVRQQHERLVLEGKGARTELDSASAEADKLRAELAGLAEAEGRLLDLRPVAAGLAELEALVAALAAVSAAGRELVKLPERPAPPNPEEDLLSAASQAAMKARSGLGSAEALRESAVLEVDRARQAVQRSAQLSAEEDCPLCGQELGPAFGQVQAHRAEELQVARERLVGAETALKKAEAEAQASLDRLEAIEAEVKAARARQAAWQQAEARRAAVLDRLAQARSALMATSLELAETIGQGPEELSRAEDEVGEQLSQSRAAHDEVVRLLGRLERRHDAEAALRQAEERSANASALVAILRSKVKDLGFEPARLEAAKASLSEAAAVAEDAQARAHAARLRAVEARAGASGEARRLAEAQEQHSRLEDLESQSLHLGRTAELLNVFRNSVVASVGPRLAVQAAELFDELTDSEYDRLEVDPETYGLRISDAGASYDLERFSGSEVDLANLALRVAISEHVRFQSGGSVGLLVLDEVFGPLDEERKARMILALEHLRGRFRQILVV